jgi:RNA polymerase sigma factor (sigma-70 family)
MVSDAALLARYASAQDADAFGELYRRYAGLVYGTCLRVMRDREDAQDVAQECFLELARKAGSITSSLPGWLHTLARSRSVDAIRKASVRRRYEAEAASREPAAGEATWADLAPEVDRALETLPEHLRAPVILHYLQGRNQSEVAAELGVDQSTVSRLLQRAVAQLREHLKTTGVIVSAAALSALLAENAATAAPDALIASLGKMAIAGVGDGGAPVVSAGAGGSSPAASTAFLGSVHGKLAVVVGVIAVALVGVIVVRHGREVTTTNPRRIIMLTQPDYSRLHLEGDHHRLDSFSLTMQAVARLFGGDVDYETLYGLSTNGFAPDIYPAEPCRSFWRMHGRGQCLDVVAAYLGLNVRPMGVGTPEAIREAFARDEVVVMDRGWDTDIYCWWGIITQAPEDGWIRGATQNGQTDTPLDHFGRCWALTAGRPTLTQGQADRAMLERAVARIRADREPFLPGEVIYGLPAMDLWIAQMEKPAFQDDSPGDSAANARMCAIYSYEGAKVTASYLRHRLKSFPEAARPHIEATARCYERIADLLLPFTVWEEGRGYRAFMGDLARQREHADKVLRPVKAETAAAADEIEKAVAATD